MDRVVFEEDEEGGSSPNIYASISFEDCDRPPGQPAKRPSITESSGFLFRSEGEMKPSMAWPQSVIEAIDSCKFFVILLTDNALRSRDIIPEITEALAAGRIILGLQSTQNRLTPELDALLTEAHMLTVGHPIEIADIDAAWKMLVEIESNSSWDSTDALTNDSIGTEPVNSFLIHIECLRGKMSGKVSCQLGDGERVIFGRGSEADVYIDDNRASRRHAGLVVERDPRYGLELYIMDLMSRNGTWVRYRREGDPDISKFLEHTRVRVVSGAIVRIGSTDFRVTAVRVPIQLARAGT
jgi:hypothetical protein